MNLNTSSGAGAGAINLKIVSSGAGTWPILGQLPSPERKADSKEEREASKKSLPRTSTRKHERVSGCKSSPG